MRRFITAGRPSPAMAVAFVALLMALSSYAGALPGTAVVDSGDIRNNSVRGKDIRNNNVEGKDIKNGAVTSIDVKNDTLTGADVDESSLRTLPEGFHQVGAPGEPFFQHGCGQYTLGIAGLEVQPVGFYKDRENLVHLRGAYQCPSKAATAFQLPPGYRLANNRIADFAAGCLDACSEFDSGGDVNNENLGVVEILGGGIDPGADGLVRASGTATTLDGITFSAER